MGRRGLRTLHFVHAVRNFVGIFHDVIGVVRDFVRVFLNSVCGLPNFAYAAHNSHIGFRRIWVDNDSVGSGKLDGQFAYPLCAQWSPYRCEP